jgi:hypothetical protein
MVRGKSWWIPTTREGTTTLYYEDKWAILWNVSTQSFEHRGCFTAGHTGEGRPFGNKYTPNAGELLDMWHMKRVRTGTVGQADDQYVDSIRYDKDKAPEAGRKSDPNTGGYKNNVSETRRARSSPRRATRQHHHTGS